MHYRKWKRHVGKKKCKWITKNSIGQDEEGDDTCSRVGTCKVQAYCVCGGLWKMFPSCFGQLMGESRALTYARRPVVSVLGAPSWAVGVLLLAVTLRPVANLDVKAADGAGRACDNLHPFATRRAAWLYLGKGPAGSNSA